MSTAFQWVCYAFFRCQYTSFAYLGGKRKQFDHIRREGTVQPRLLVQTILDTT